MNFLDKAGLSYFTDKFKKYLGDNYVPLSKIGTLTGPRGYQGVRGFQGFQGTQGVRGYQGFQGGWFAKAYKLSDELPKSKPTTTEVSVYNDKQNNDLGNGWVKTIPDSLISNIEINHFVGGGVWQEVIVDGYKYYKSPTVGDDNIATMRIYFTTTMDNVAILVHLKAYSEEDCDFVLVSNLDEETLILEDCLNCISGKGTEIVQDINVPIAGTHFITVGYSKDSSVEANGDYGLVRISSDSNIINSIEGYVQGNLISWNNPYRVTGYQGIPGRDGMDGRDGPRGPRGYQGYQGERGSDGSDGPSGHRGFQGFQGTSGTNGQSIKGDRGFQGFQGFQGTSGTNGQSIKGDRGFQGFQGATGTPYWTSGTSTGGTGNIAASYHVYATAFYQGSDERLKNIHSNVEVDFNKLSEIRKVLFEYKSNPGTEYIGTVAQDVQKVYPEIVSMNEDGYLAVQYDKLAVIALAAIDKIDERLRKLESKL